MTFASTFHSLWQILVIGILLGAGLPALFAVGVRCSTSGQPGGKFAAGLCFGIVVIAIVVGIAFIMKNFLAHDFGLHLF